MAQRLITPTFRAVANGGVPIAGAQLFVYTAETTTKVNTYSDDDLTVANSNPVVADAQGYFPDMFVPAGLYKVGYALADEPDPPSTFIDVWDNIDIREDSSFSGGINAEGFTEHLINLQTSTSYTYLTGDRAKHVVHINSNPIAATLPQANSTTFRNGWYILVSNRGSGTVTITPTTSTIDGNASLVLIKGQSVIILSDGTNYRTHAYTGQAIPIDAQTGTTYTFTTDDKTRLVTFSNASAIAATLPQAGTSFPADWYVTCKNNGAGDVTITPTTSTINGAASYVLQRGEFITIVSDGTDYQVFGNSSGAQVGDFKTSALSASHGRWLLCDGSAISRTTYATLFTAISTSFGVGDGSTTFNLPDPRGQVVGISGTATRTASGEDADVDTSADTLTVPTNTDKWITGMAVVFTLASGTITGLTSSNTYYVIRNSSTTIKLASSLANAQNGTAIDLTAKSSPVWTITHTMTTRAAGDQVGEQTHAISSTESLLHSHGLDASSGASNTGSGKPGTFDTDSGNDFNTKTFGGNAAMNNMQPTLFIGNLFIYAGV